MRPVLALAIALATAACGDTVTSPESDLPASEATITATVVAEAPVEGARLSGTVTFRARVSGASPSSYRMVWLVDGDRENAMQDATGADEAAVNVSGWTWRGEGPYRVTFRAYDKRNRRMGETSVNVTVGEPLPAPVMMPPGAGNPLAGAAFYVDPNSNARQTASAWRATRPADAAAMEVLASRPQAKWFGDWSGDVRLKVDAQVAKEVAAGALPILVAYNIPVRDCSSYSAGGATSGAAYRAWIRAFATGLSGRKAVVILEPDALAGMDCLSATLQAERIALISDAVSVLTAAGAAVYVDAGNANWKSAATMAQRLRDAGVAGAAGFALNVSNFIATPASVTYGQAIRALLGGKSFVIDTSRNGLGTDPAGEWCNPYGRALGAAATGSTGIDGVDAFLYVKRPGESDGTCNGGPAAGGWWADYALGLTQRAQGGSLMAAR